MILQSSDFDQLLAQNRHNTINSNSAAAATADNNGFRIRESILLHFDPLRECPPAADCTQNNATNNNISTATGDHQRTVVAVDNTSADAGSSSALMLEPNVDDDTADDVANEAAVADEGVHRVLNRSVTAGLRQTIHSSRNASIEAAAVGGFVDVDAAIALATAEQRTTERTTATEAAQMVSPMEYLYPARLN